MKSLRALFLVTMLATVLVPVGARAEQPHDHRTHPHARATAPELGPGAERLASGLWRVTSADGHIVYTHGGDPAVPDHGTGFNVGDPERAPACATDYYQHVLYGRKVASPDRYASSVERIRAAVRRMNAVLNEQSLLSGGPTADFKVACDPGTSTISVGQFTAATDDYSTIMSSARANGFDSPNVDYTIFWDGDFPGICGVGSFYGDERLVAGNLNNNGGAYAITYLSCWDGRTPMHENGHNQGAVQYNAPYSTGSGAHCIDQIDVMCYSPDGGDRNQTGTISRCTDRIHYDCGNDSYFDSAPEPGEYLASNWNIGSTLNRFIAFGGVTNQPPVAKFASSCSNLACSFTDQSTDADGIVTSRAWAFGDGGTSTATNPSHTYAAAGTYTVRLTVTDDDGLTTFTERALTVTAPTTAPPAPTISVPASGATVYGPTITISGTARAGSLVRVRKDGTQIASASANAAGGWSTMATLATGTHTIDATASDAGGESAPSPNRTFTVAVDTEAPAPPTISSPTSGAVVGRSPRVTGTAEPLAFVEIRVGALRVGSANASSSGAFSVSTALRQGTHTIRAFARDAAGNWSTESAPVTFEVDETPPEIAIESGAFGMTPTVHGIARDNKVVASVRVEFYNALNQLTDTVNATLDPPDESGWRAWTATASLLPGRYRVVARALDGVGLTTAATTTWIYV